MSVAGQGQDSEKAARATPFGFRACRRSRLSLSAARAWLAATLEIEAGARTAFFLVPIGLMLGILLYHDATSLWPLEMSLPATILAFALVWRLGRDRQILFSITQLFCCILLGMVVADFEMRRTDTVVFSGEATVRISGTVAWRDVDDRGRYRYLVDIVSTEKPVLSRPPGRALILVSARHPPIPVGGIFSGLVRLRPPSGPAYPGGYDFAFGAYFKGLGAYGYGLGAPSAPDPQAVIDRDPGQGLVALRLSISDRIRETIGGGAGAVASALITGERSGIPDEIDLWLRATGLSHVLSISGLHMALVAGFAMTLVRAGLAAIPGAALTLPAKKIAAMAALGISTFYLVLSGDDVATERSYVMLAIMLLAILFDRPSLTLRNVGMAAIVVLAIRPHALMTASFQMSFAATAALVGVYGAFARWRNQRADKGSRSSHVLFRLLAIAAGLAATSVIAGLATAPFSAYHFQRVAPFGLLANMLAVPIFSVWIMPLSLIAMLAMPLGLDTPILVLVGYGLDLVFLIAHTLYDIVPDRPTGLMSPMGLAVLTVALFVACLPASRLRLLSLPIAALGLILAPPRVSPPELLIFEDGKELALIDGADNLHPLRERPNGFVFQQWARSYSHDGSGVPQAFACEDIRPAIDVAVDENQVQGAQPDRRKRRYCRATSRSGLAIVWTDDATRLGRACDEADIAVVARAMRQTACRSGAYLVTLRTLRKTGSLAISRGDPNDDLDPQKPAVEGLRAASSGEPVFGPGPASLAVAISIDDGRQGLDAPWNRHRAAAWPEYWRNPDKAAKTKPEKSSTSSIPPSEPDTEPAD